MSDTFSALRDFLHQAAPARLRKPTGNLTQPFVDPGAGYEDILWDWDAYFCCLGMEPLAANDPRIGLHAKGCVDNFLQRQGPDGHVPYAVNPSTPEINQHLRAPDSVKNTSKPLLAQFAQLAQRCGGGDPTWLASVFPALTRSVDHWFDTQNTRFDLLTWRSHRGSGVDNHPAVFQRPHNTVADPYLNAMMVKECRALAEIADVISQPGSLWTTRADTLSAAIEKWMWDPIDGTYYCIDVAQGDPGKVRTPANWAVPLKFRSWSMVMPLWAGIAAPERARRVIHEHVLAPEQLRSPAGLRSLAKVEPAYQIFSDFNPSDWLGPIWVVSTYLTWEALRKYGANAEASALAHDLCTMLQNDVRTHGCLHEYYHPETGEGLTHPGFMNWNTCALRMLEEMNS